MNNETFVQNNKLPVTDSGLIAVYESNMVWNGVTTTSDGRVFVCFPHLESNAGIKIGEILSNGTVVPFPNEQWNSWKVSEDPTEKFVRTNSLRIGPDGNLWIVDTGCPTFGSAPIKGGAKLVVVDIKKNEISRIISCDDFIKKNSAIDDLRIGKSFIYVTDAGEPSLIVIDLKTGKGRRVLENQISTTDSRPMYAEGKVMMEQGDKEFRLHADQLELSPDEKFLYFQPASGPMFRIETKFLNDPALTAINLSAKAVLWSCTPTTGGTAMDLDENIYVSDVDHLQILKITPEGKSSILIKDDRLTWIDALWIDGEGYLWMPEAQLNRTAPFQNGISRVVFPVHIYKLKIDVKQIKY
ncbi:L-dopachrome tautomerase-related protein [uncultured Mucilaginibacter sp.]|uniref:L-dopachrome tautomerase-related protein n=1 Tax=uncultured Mucilaginibacter sp. TaxID=797541 RepID=UPI00262A663D|nr:L-dopachrome tautomerase-related protein [uncultured Mucilaginibacter sp.]